MAQRDDPPTPLPAGRSPRQGEARRRAGFPSSRVLVAVLLVLLVGVGALVGYFVLGPGRGSTPPDATVAAATSAPAAAAPAEPAPAVTSGDGGSPGVAAAAPAATPGEPAAAAEPSTPASEVAPSTPAPIQPAAAPSAPTDAGDVTASAAPAASTTPDAAPPAAAAPAPNKVQHIGDWFLICPADGTGTEKCVVRQELHTPDNKQVLLVWTMRTDGQGMVHVVWQMPAGLDAPHGMVLDIGDGKPKAVPFSSCDSQSCTVAVRLTPEYLVKIEAATTISATVLPAVANAQPVRLDLSAKGLGEALAQLVPPPAS